MSYSKLQQVLGLEVLQIFNLTEKAENRSSGTVLKQVVNEAAKEHSKALEQVNSEIIYLRSKLHIPPPLKGKK